MNSHRKTRESTDVPTTPFKACTRDVEVEFQAIRDALQGLRYGALTIIVQDGVIVQIDRVEKMRFQRSKTPTGADHRVS